MQKAGPRFTVERWSDWQPVANGRSLCTRYVRGETERCEVSAPNLARVPALLRRRLGPVARVVFHVLDHCADTTRQEPVILSSVLGDINRTQSILQAIVAGEDVSPAAFSLSVHNSIGGLWTLAHDIRAPIVALAPIDYSPVPAVLEAVGLLESGRYPAVNVVYYEDRYPDHYLGFFDPPPGPTALALRVVAPDAESADPSFRVGMQPGRQSREGASRSNYSALTELLLGRQSAVEISEPRCGWRLERLS